MNLRDIYPGLEGLSESLPLWSPWAGCSSQRLCGERMSTLGSWFRSLGERIASSWVSLWLVWSVGAVFGVIQPCADWFYRHLRMVASACTHRIYRRWSLFARNQFDAPKVCIFMSKGMLLYQHFQCHCLSLVWRLRQKSANFCYLCIFVVIMSKEKHLTVRQIFGWVFLLYGLWFWSKNQSYKVSFGWNIIVNDNL